MAAAEFHTDHYLRHNQRLLEHLATLGLPIAGRTVLEVGAGIGDLTSFFLDRAIRRAEAAVLGREARLVDAEDPLGRHVWFRFSAKSGEFLVKGDSIVFRPEAVGKQAVGVAAITENLGVAREQVEFTV